MFAELDRTGRFDREPVARAVRLVLVTGVHANRWKTAKTSQKPVKPARTGGLPVEPSLKNRRSCAVSCFRRRQAGHLPPFSIDWHWLLLFLCDLRLIHCSPGILLRRERDKTNRKDRDVESERDCR